MTTIDDILAHFRTGRVTRGEIVAESARLITPSNVAEVMAELPVDIARDLESWACTVPWHEGVVLGANIPEVHAQRVAREQLAASQAIREWSARNRIADGHYCHSDNAQDPGAVAP